MESPRAFKRELSFADSPKNMDTPRARGHRAGTTSLNSPRLEMAVRKVKSMGTPKARGTHRDDPDPVPGTPRSVDTPRVRGNLSMPQTLEDGGTEPHGSHGTLATVMAAAKLKDHLRARKEGPYGSGRAPVPERPRWRSARPSSNASPRPPGTAEQPRRVVRTTSSVAADVSPRTSSAGMPIQRTQTFGGGGEAKRSTAGSSAFNHAATVDLFNPDYLPSDIELVLSDMPVLNACPQALLSALAELCKVREVAANEEIVCRGQAASGAVLILKGRANISIGSALCGSLSRGKFFGETYLLGLEQHWAVTISSEVTTAVAELSREDFQQACESYTDVAKWYEAIKKGGIAGLAEGITTNTCELLDGLRPETLSSIEQCASARVYFPGEVMIGQGERNEEFCILVQGRAAVQVAGRSVRELDRARAKTPPCIGETGLFGLRSPKGTCVSARSVCLVRIIYRTVLVNQMQGSTDALAIERLGKAMARSNPQAHSKLPLFEDIGCNPTFVQFVADNLEGRVFLPGQVISDGSPRVTPPLDRCMFSLVEGFATVTEGDKEVAVLGAGSIFGDAVLLGLDLDSSLMVVAMCTCHVEVLHQSVIVTAAKQHPEDREKVLNMAVRRMKELRKKGDDPSRRSISSLQRRSEKFDGNEKARLMSATTGNSHNSLEFLTAPFFEGMSMECLEKISSVTKTKLFLPGELITEQGESGESMFIMVSGSAGAFVRSDQDGQVQNVALHSPFKTGNLERMRMNKVQDLKPGSVFGELAMLGIMPTRAASVQAEALCSLWEVHQADMMNIVSEFPDAQKKISSIVSGNLESSVPARLQSLPLFKDFDQSFKMLLSLYSYRRVYFPGERICQGGRTGDGLYLLNVGEAEVERGGVRFMRLGPGSHFGSTLMLGIHKLFPGTLEACAVCHVLIITRESFLMALERYPAPAAAQALKKAEAKSAEELQARMRRAVVKDQVFVTCEEPTRDRHGRKSTRKSFASFLKPGQGKPLGEDLREVFLAWRTQAHKSSGQRRKEQRQAGRWSWWVSGRQVAMQQRIESDRQATQETQWRDEFRPPDEMPELTFVFGKEQRQSPRWTQPLAPYALVDTTPRRYRQTEPGLPQLATAAPDMRPILRILDSRQHDTAALATAHSQAADGPDIRLLKDAALAVAAASPSVF